MEGLWDPNEADGGAHVFFGPTVELESPGRIEETSGSARLRDPETS
jgi:hypothetical protein